jgi:NADPH2:quinone reductase
MKAVLCKTWGDPSTLTLEDVPSKAPGAGEARLRVRACGVNFADTLMIQGKYQVRPPFPFSPGLEAAGDVLEVGAGVTHLKPGDRVLCITGYGGMAEELVVPAEMVIPMPPNMDYATAAGFPIAYGTSHVALDHRAHLQPGETLLVLGAAGGVGLTAVEIGKKMGATVIAAASTPEKLALTREYGADHTIEYTRENLRDRLKDITGGRSVNVVYDPVGGDLFEPALRSIAWEGRYLVIGFASGTIPQFPANLALMKNASVVGVLWGAYAANSPAVLRASLGTLLRWYAEGGLRPHISQTFLLEHAADALWSLLRRQSTGKVVVEIAQCEPL